MKYHFTLILLIIISSFALFAQKTGFPENGEYQVKRLSPVINTSSDEIAPYFIKKFNLLVFTSDKKYNGKGGNQNLYLSKKIDTNWLEPLQLSSYVNSKYDNGSFSLKEKENNIYFARKINRNTDIYECESFINDSNIYIFSEPKECSTLNSINWDSEPCIIQDGQKIFFASNRPGGFGGADIWSSDWDGEKWGIPYNLGEKINSEYDEFAPFFYNNTKELYFSSNKKGGFGKLDFYASQLHDSGWTFPQNLGGLINSNKDELFFFRSGDTAFFSSNRYDKNYDIYMIAPRITISEKPVVKHITKWCGIFNKVSSKPINNFTAKIEDLVDSKILAIIPDSICPEKFHFESLPNHLHKILIRSKDFFDYVEYYKSDTNSEMDKKEIYLIPYENTYVLNVSFKKNESILDELSYPALDSAFEMLQKYPDMTAEIAGHTNSEGNKSLNIWVSQLRADVVKKYLVGKGIPAERITAKGYGSTQLIRSDNAEDSSNINRRVEMRTKRRN